MKALTLTGDEPGYPVGSRHLKSVEQGKLEILEFLVWMCVGWLVTRRKAGGSVSVKGDIGATPHTSLMEVFP